MIFAFRTEQYKYMGSRCKTCDYRKSLTASLMPDVNDDRERLVADENTNHHIKVARSRNLLLITLECRKILFMWE